jgi:hypothetical protein
LPYVAWSRFLHVDIYRAPPPRPDRTPRSPQAPPPRVTSRQHTAASERVEDAGPIFRQAWTRHGAQPRRVSPRSARARCR